MDNQKEKDKNKGMDSKLRSLRFSAKPEIKMIKWFKQIEVFVLKHALQTFFHIYIL